MSRARSSWRRSRSPPLVVAAAHDADRRAHRARARRRRSARRAQGQPAPRHPAARRHRGRARLLRRARRGADPDRRRDTSSAATSRASCSARLILLALGVVDDSQGALGAHQAAVPDRGRGRRDPLRLPHRPPDGPDLAATSGTSRNPLVWIVTGLWIVGHHQRDEPDGRPRRSGRGHRLRSSATTLTLIAWQADQIAGRLRRPRLLGALLGFLPYNFPPARIFLGDTGALFIGFNLSLLALEGYRQACRCSPSSCRCSRSPCR